MLYKTFARRVGKSLTDTRKHCLEYELPRRLFDPLVHNNELTAGTWVLEIGFGMGQHFLHQIVAYPDQQFIGAEVYINGVAQLLNHADLYEKQTGNTLNNFFIWPDDIDLLLPRLPNHFLTKVYILFPDPWPKRRQHKKRLLNHARMTTIKSKMQDGGVIIFASDIESYFDDVIELVEHDHELSFMHRDFYLPPDDYIMTKYHSKAIQAGRAARFMSVVKGN